MSDTAPGWYDDPQGGGGARWFDGVRWTEHVHAPIPVDPAAAAAAAAAARASAAAVDALVSAPAWEVDLHQHGTPTQLVQPITGPGRRLLGTLVEERQHGVAGVLSHVDNGQALQGRQLSVTATDGTTVGVLRRAGGPGAVPVQVFDAAGTQIGVVAVRNDVGWLGIGVWLGHDLVGSFDSHTPRDPFVQLRAADGSEIARLSRIWNGVSGVALHDEDRHRFEAPNGLPDALRPMGLLGALAIDLALAMVRPAHFYGG